MPVPFHRMRSLETQRVLMHFDDGHQVIATLLSASEDLDGRHHLVYDRVEWASNPNELASANNEAAYAEGESLLSIEPAGLPHA